MAHALSGVPFVVAAATDVEGVILVASEADDAEANDALAAGGGLQGNSMNNIRVTVGHAVESVVAAGRDVGRIGDGIAVVDGQNQVGVNGAVVGGVSSSSVIGTTGGQSVAPWSDVSVAGSGSKRVILVATRLLQGDVDFDDAVTQGNSFQGVKECAGGGPYGTVPFYTADAAQFNGVEGVHSCAVEGEVEHIHSVAYGIRHDGVARVGRAVDVPSVGTTGGLRDGHDSVAGCQLAECHRQAYNSQNQTQ